MDGFSAVPDEIRTYGDIATEAAGQIAAAGGLDIATSVAALTPVFGAIGADFLTTSAATQTAHVQSVAALANVYAGTGSVAHAVAAAYDTAEHGTGSILSAARNALGGNV
ncbi:ESX-1 secretion-associated protein [Rhodococcus sp. ABRD24]|nr:ESX-1 secretion-associated protein [Rhodococcus sp. ABRD24]